MRNVLITGAGRGLGKAMAEQFAARDYGLMLVARTEEARADLVEQFPQAKILIADITSEDYRERLSRWLDDTTLDVVINNAASGSCAPTLESTTEQMLRNEFETNCVAVLTTVKSCLPALEKSERPQVINISSRRGSLTMQSQLAAKGSGCSYSYRISKAAQNMLSLCLADDLEEFGIKVVSIHPGRLLTEMAPKDAHMSPQASAQKIVQMIADDDFSNRDFYSVECGRLPW